MRRHSKFFKWQIGRVLAFWRRVSLSKNCKNYEYEMLSLQITVCILLQNELISIKPWVKISFQCDIVGGEDMIAIISIHTIWKLWLLNQSDRTSHGLFGLKREKNNNPKYINACIFIIRNGCVQTLYPFCIWCSVPYFIEN